MLVTENTSKIASISVANSSSCEIPAMATSSDVAGGRTVVIGVKLDEQSRELLTWALLKAAHPGDRLIALHVLANHEIVDGDGKSSLLALVKAFDSILAVYEGFCSLKQVDLKLRICRGGSIRKILVRESKSYDANEVIVGTPRTHHTIKSSSSLAKYCARKLSKNCLIIAVNNGKIVFRRDSPSSLSNFSAKGTSDHRKSRLLSVIQRSLSLNSKLLNGEEKCNQSGCKKLELTLVKSESDSTRTALKDSCSICSPDLVHSRNSCVLEDSFRNGDEEDNSMAMVPEQKLSNRLYSNRSSVRKISMIQWAMRLPTRHCFQITNSDLRKNIVFNDEKGKSLEVNGENGAIVTVSGDEIRSDSTILSKELEGLHEKYSASCRLFTYQELLSATLNFKPENVIGKGGNSQVYRGCLPDGKELAVKILKASEDVLKEFVMEIEIINALRHENIISIFGFSFEANNLLLVYDFLSRGSLEDNLHGNKDSEFGWSKRYKVAVGVAKALVYLHSKCDKPVIHRDVKSSNILLSKDFEPQLSDFGLAKWASSTSSHITCDDVSGTFGYMAPEYFMYGKVTDKIDIYAFGVVLLELLSGRKPISCEYPKGEESLVMWAKPILSSGKFRQLLDPSLGNNYDANEMERMALASALCIRRAPRARPQMSTILKLLGGDHDLTTWARLELDSTGGSDVRLLDGGDGLEEEGFSQSHLRSHLSLALLDIDDSSLSMSSVEESVSLEDYLRGRWSRSSSFA